MADEVMEEDNTWNKKKQIVIEQVANKVINGDDIFIKIQGARDIRRLVRNSSAVRARSNFAAAGVIPALVPMLSSLNFEAKEASLVALLNLAARNELYVIFGDFFFNYCSICMQLLLLVWNL